jgi:hypothetical protein
MMQAGDLPLAETFICQTAATDVSIFREPRLRLCTGLSVREPWWLYVIERDIDRKLIFMQTEYMISKLKYFIKIL